MLRRIRLILLNGLLYSFAFILNACNETATKKESWAVIINFFSPDTSYYPATTKFPFPDTLQYASLENFFTNRDRAPVIHDSAIIIYDNYTMNGQRVCCKEDTLEVFIDTIHQKKYLFAIGEYIAVFSSDSNSTKNLRPRMDPLLVLWGLRLNTPYASEKFTEEYEKLGAQFVTLDERFDEVYRQKWTEDEALLVETIQFNNSNDRIVTQIYKDMDQQEADSTISYFKTNFPQMRYREVKQQKDDGGSQRMIRMNFNGIVISLVQNSASEFSFTVTDYYETIRHILSNMGTGYIYRDDVRIY